MVKIKSVNRWIGLLSLLVISLMLLAPPSRESVVDTDSTGFNSKPLSSAPVEITTNDGYGSFSSQGDGTSGNRYIIENRAFNAEGGLYALRIRGVSAYVTFRNVTFYGTTLDNVIDPDLGLRRYDIAAVQIENSRNIIFERCTFRNSFNGIYINSSSQEITINNNAFYDLAYAGVHLVSSPYKVDIVYNRVYRVGEYGFNLEARSTTSHTAHNIIYDISNTGILMKSPSSNNVYNNTLYRIRNIGIDLLNPTTSHVTQNNITDVGAGISMKNAASSDIKDNIITQASSYGIKVDSVGNINISINQISQCQTGIYVKNADLPGTARVEYNTANYNDYGIWFDKGNNPVVRYNTVRYNRLFGVRVQSTTGAVVKSNTINNNDDIGFEDQSNINLNATANTISVNAGDGVQIIGSVNSNYGGAYTDLNTIHYSGKNGVVLDGTSCQLLMNSIRYSGKNGIVITGASNALSGNVIQDTTENGIYSNAYNSTITNLNRIITSGKNGIVLRGSNSLVQNAYIEDSKENGISIESQFSVIAVNTINNTNKSAIVVGGISNTIGNNSMDNSGIILNETESSENLKSNNIQGNNRINVGQTGGPYYVHFVKDQTGGTINSASYRCILMVDCNGVTLSNLQLSNVAYGAQIINSPNVIIQSVTAENNRLSGIRAINADRLKVQASIIRNSGQDGIYVEGIDCKVIDNTNVTDSLYTGINVRGLRCQVLDSVVSGSGINGIEITGTNATVNNSHIINAGNTGISISGNSSVLYNDRIDTSGVFGLFLKDSSYSEILNVIITASGETDAVLSMVNDTKMEYATITSSVRNIFVNQSARVSFRHFTLVGFGFHFDGSNVDCFATHTFDTITLNSRPVSYQANRNKPNVVGGPYGQVIIANCESATVREMITNPIQNAYVGIAVYYSIDTTLLSCRVTTADYAGILISNSEGTMVRNCNLQSNTGSFGALYIKESNDTEVMDSLFHANGYGIWQMYSRGTYIHNSNFTNNLYIAIEIQHSTGSMLVQNRFQNNQIYNLESWNCTLETYQYNQFASFNYAGIRSVANYDCIIKGNSFKSGQNTNGIYLEATDYCQILENSFTEFNGGIGIYCALDSSDNDIRENIILSDTISPMTYGIRVHGAQNQLLYNRIQYALVGIHVEGAESYVYKNQVVFAPRAIVLNAAPNSIVSENEISSSNIFAIRIQGGSNYTVAIKNQISLSYRTFVVDTSFWVNITYNRYCNNMFSSTERIGVLSTEIYENWNSFCLESDETSTGDLLDSGDSENQVYRREHELQWLEDLQTNTLAFMFQWGIYILIAVVVAGFFLSPKGRDLISKAKSRKAVGF